ncbi:hypothetical protein ACFLU6_14995 [Acidobacteriota bacterium]
MRRILLFSLLGSMCLCSWSFGGWTVDALLTSRFEYFDDEDIFGGEYAPFYQFLTLKVKQSDQGKVEFRTRLYATKDLSTDESFFADFYSLNLIVRDIHKIRRVRLGRFVLTEGVGFNILDGGEIVLNPHKKIDLGFYLGRNKIFYDTRYADTLLERAPFSDTGLLYGGNVYFKPVETTRLKLGYSAFDSEMGAGVQDHVTFELSSDLPRGFKIDFGGYEDIAEESGREIGGSVVRSWGRGSKAQAYYRRVRPDRINPEIITSIFVADEVGILGLGGSCALNEHLTLEGEYERYDFAWPGGSDPEKTSHALRVGIDANTWTRWGLTARVGYRYLTGDVGNLHQLSFVGEKRITSNISGGWLLDYVNYRRGDDERENAWILAGRTTVYLWRNVWFLWELESYNNIEFDYNLRTRFTLNVGLHHETK